MKKLGKIKTLTIASLSAVALAAPIAFAQSTTTRLRTLSRSPGERHGGHGKGWAVERGATAWRSWRRAWRHAVA